MVYPSDFSWLPNNILKGVKLPKIVYGKDTGEYSGYYQTGSDTIVVVPHEPELIPAIIAHELKHYLQYINGYKLKTLKFDLELPYERAIHNYFNSSWSEMDALRFEFKYAKTWLNEWWYRKLVLEL